MKDYNKPPTQEFEFLTNSPKYAWQMDNNYYPWLTLMKAVMNDYWFDHPNYNEYNASELDHLFHKLYYCWKMTMEQIHGDEEK